MQVRLGSERRAPLKKMKDSRNATNELQMNEKREILGGLF